MGIFSFQTDIASAFLSTLVHSLWIGGVCLIILRVGLNLLSEFQSGFRYALSKIILFIFLLTIVFLFGYIYQPQSEFPYTISQTLKDSILSGNTIFAGMADIHNSSTPFRSLILKLYFVGLIVFTLRFVFASLLIKRRIRNGYEVERKYVNYIKELGCKFNIRKSIRLLYSEEISSPALFGFLRPVILVPTGMFTNLPFDQVESILIHELIHLKRFDFIVNIIQHVLEVIFFFNPFMWMISGIVRNEREKYCDDRVVRSYSSPKTYAKALYNLSLIEHEKLSPAVKLAGTDNKQLLLRIQRVLKTDIMKKKIKNRGYVAGLAAIGLAIIITLSGFNSALLNINKSQNKVEINDNQSFSNSDYSQNLQEAESLLCAEDTLSQKEKQELIEKLEESLKELQSIDWDVKMKEIQETQEELLSEIPQRLEEQQLRIQEELKNIDEEKIREQMEIAQRHLDSIHERILNDTILIKMQMEFQEQVAAMQDIDIDFEEMLESISSSMEDINFDLDLDIDIDMESIAMSVEEALRDIDFEEIKQDIEKTIQELEFKIQELKSEGN